MRAAASFHRNDTRGLLRRKRDYAFPSHAAPHDNRSRHVEANNAAAVLSKVDTEYGNGDSPAPFSSHRSIPRSNRGGPSIRGARANAIGISRGGRTTKIHALVYVLGRPPRLVLTPGNASDVKGADLLIGETVEMKRVIADRGYDANRIRAALREQGTIPVIPGRRNRKRPIQYDERRYKDRCRVEAMFCRLKTSAASLPTTTSAPETSFQP